MWLDRWFGADEEREGWGDCDGICWHGCFLHGRILTEIAVHETRRDFLEKRKFRYLFFFA